MPEEGRVLQKGVEGDIQRDTLPVWDRLVSTIPTRVLYWYGWLRAPEATRRSWYTVEFFAHFFQPDELVKETLSPLARAAMLKAI